MAKRWFIPVLLALGFNVANAGLVVERATAYPQQHNKVYWQCTDDGRAYNNENACYFDVDGPLGTTKPVHISGQIDTSYSEPGFYEVWYGSTYCSFGSSCESVTYQRDRFAVMPLNNWQISVSGSSKVDVNKTATFSSTATKGTDCCEFQWYFGDGKSKTDYQTDGSSSVTHSYASPGTYKVKVYLKDRKSSVRASNYGSTVVGQWSVTVEGTVTPPPEPAPEPVPAPAPEKITSMKYVNPYIGGTWTMTLYDSSAAAGTKSLYTQDYSRSTKRTKIIWENEDDASLHIQYRIDFGPGGVTEGIDDVNWTTATLTLPAAYSWSIDPIPQQIDRLLASGELVLPAHGYVRPISEWVRVYYRFRSVRGGANSSWQYARPIWLYDSSNYERHQKLYVKDIDATVGNQDNELRYQGHRLGYTSQDISVINSTATEFCKLQGYKSFSGSSPKTSFFGGSSYAFNRENGYGWIISGSTIYTIDSVLCYGWPDD